ncbi:MAG: GNAT family N-acetyltransferase [Anaerocolumna sp.]
MLQELSDQFIILKEYLTPKDSEDANNLAMLCYTYDHTNLKLELDYKLSITKESKTGLKEVNEYLYYVGGVLVSYLGISSFGGNVYELNGMTHPEFRRKGLFKKLLSLALQELKNNGQKELLLLSDEKSDSGKQLIHWAGGVYKTSEYRMKQNINSLPAYNSLQDTSEITLITADVSDLAEICRQNAVYFHTTEESEALIIDESMLNDGMHMIKKNGETIGKINVEYGKDSSFIFGFGIIPEYRGNGYGKAAFGELLKIIKDKNISDVQLDVATQNKNALNLYKSFGFEETSVMDYYEYRITE